MMGLELLRSVVAEGSVDGDRRRLPLGELRFVLEYPRPPDIAVERAAIAAALGVGGIDLEPLFPQADGDLAHYLVLRFPGIERTLSNESLFAGAYALSGACGAQRVEPDLGSRVYVDPMEPGSLEAGQEAADVLGPLCWVDGAPPADTRWALESLRVQNAWDRFGTRGAGVLVGQPDTGVTVHVELEDGSLDLTMAADVIDGDGDPTDPMREGAANPGHGTSTASVVVSRCNGRITGTAPEARVVPIRCIEDVKVIDGVPVAAAIEHASRIGCDVVTMSLGGLPSMAVHAAVRDAVGKGAIVLAAAGNCVGLVVYPARYDEVIAVAGVSAIDLPWKGSSRGADVDISAPAEFVWRAERTRPSDPGTTVSAGQGTSFAVALTAGVAALWVSHHGREAVRGEARRRGTTVQNLFKAALQASSRRPPNWDAELYGAGIADAEALLAIELTDIVTTSLENTPSRKKHHVERLLDEVAGARAAGGPFDWRTYGPEVAAILLEDARMGRRGPGAGLEARNSWMRASPALAECAAASEDPRLREIAARKPHRGAMAKPPSTEWPVDAPDSLVRILGRSRRSRGSADGQVSLDAARRRLLKDGIRSTLDAAERTMSALEASAGMSADRDRLKEAVLGRGEAVLERLARKESTWINPMDRLAIEALVGVTDRPAIRVDGGTIDPNHPELGMWQGPYLTGRDEIDALFASVGRIDLDGIHVGTGFVVGNGLVMTNRHVAEAVAAPVPTRRSPRRWVLDQGQITIDFSEGADGRERFRVASVLLAGPDQITDAPIDFHHLDLALLEVEATSSAGTPLPRPLGLALAPGPATVRGQVFVVGYPARPAALPTDADGRIRMDVVARLRALFGVRYGQKYFCPGAISFPVVAGGAGGRNWVFDHDATTLGGNSGSCVGWFDGAGFVLGLHFAGDWLRANHAHALSAVRASEAMPELSRLNWG